MKPETVQQLLTWYRNNRRLLPFRQDRDPYRIWVSEIMAQQTRIEAMLSHYERFMTLYPTLPDLAEADEDELLKVWQGLGYYSRARNLRKAAQICVKEYGGSLPRTKEELRKLPGIGDYTAGAIASIACSQRVTAIDGNVVRVGCRYFWLDLDPSSSKDRKRLDERIEAILPGEDDMPDFTQALMELGATICLPRSADCVRCPLEAGCLAAGRDDPLALPRKRKKAARRIEKKTAVIRAAFHEGQWWLSVHKRPAKGLLAGLYEFDWSLPDCVLDSVELEAYRHIFSHVEWEMNGILAICPWQDDFTLLEEVEQTAAVPSALMPFYQDARAVLAAHPDGWN